MKSLFAVILLNIFSLAGLAPLPDTGNNWELKKEKDGILVYTRDIPNSNLKEVKIQMTLMNTSMDDILTILKNSSGYKDWMFKCSDSKMVEEISANEEISYYKFDFPWPFNDREAYLKSSIQQEGKTTTINTISVPYKNGTDDTIVRITEHFNQWVFEEKINNQITLNYYVKSHPAGSIPDWLVNMAIDRGPTQSLTNFRNLLHK